jgi:Asp-tRNA(Asn)/Glu-tRNA(Gln) amidotransferase A subunit family amidase
MTAAHRLSAVAALSALDAGSLSCEALLRDCLDRIEEREAEVGAWQYLAKEAALQRARAMDRDGRQGVLAGLPIGVKDLFDTYDMATEYGSSIYAGHRPRTDAASVAAARLAGALLVGKTVTTEFASYHPAKTRNPNNTAHTPGGSSSGSAAAVADFHVPLALGTQTAGSIIRPASFCGIVGYKPSFGLISRGGVKPFADSLDTVGVFGRSVEDVALFASALSDRPELRAAQRDTPPRIGLCRTYQWPSAAIETVRAVEGAGECLAAAGASVMDVQLTSSYVRLANAQNDVMTYEAARALAFERHAHGEALSARLREILDGGRAVTAAQYDAALALFDECRRDLAQILDGVDVLIAPSTIGEAPAGVAATGDPLFNRIWSALGVPCINLPGYFGDHGLPVGVQVIGARGGDAFLLANATWMSYRLK